MLEAELDRLLPGGGRPVAARATVAELDRLVARGVPFAAAARALATRSPVLLSRARGDAGVLETARARRAILATSDRRLAARALAVGVPVIGPRDRARLGLRRPRPASSRATVKTRTSVARRRTAGP